MTTKTRTHQTVTRGYATTHTTTYTLQLKMTFNDELDKILINAYSQKRTIMERNDRTTQANAARNRAWEDITKLINSASTMKKTKNQVVARFKYLNSKAKQKNLARKKHVKGTGGGPPLNNVDPISNTLIEINQNDPTYAGLPGAVETTIGEIRTTATTTMDATLSTESMPAMEETPIGLLDETMGELRKFLVKN